MEKLPGNISITSSTTAFIQSIDFSRVSKILLIAHTGRRIFHALQEAIDDFLDRGQVNPDLEINVLLRNPYAENQDRYGHIYNSVRLLKRLQTRDNINIDVRYYQSLPVFRAIFCCYPDTDARQSIVSTYKWLPRFRSRAFEQMIRIDDTVNGEGRHPINQTVLSWFEHYWGVNEIHTIVFDFDDTIAGTMNIQVESWVKAVQQRADTDKGRTYLAPDIAAALTENNPGKLTGIIKKIFLDKQMAPAIFEAIFPNFPESEKELKDEINDSRFDIRERL
ncbi:MAG: hypothetical protein GY950_01555, partial [bacterium]|nr:hypothetical protein [bacterium]